MDDAYAWIGIFICSWMLNYGVKTVDNCTKYFLQFYSKMSIYKINIWNYAS